MRAALWLCSVFATERRFRRRSSACVPMICCRRSFRMRRVLPEAVLGEIGRLNPEAIAEVCDEAWPDVRDAEELHDALLTLTTLPATTNQELLRNNRLLAKLQESLNAWRPLFDQLFADRRAGRANMGSATYWIAAERVPAFTQIFQAARFEVSPPKLESRTVSGEDSLLSLVTGWMSHAGPVAAAQLASLLSLPVSDIDKALLRLESSGVVLRGKFSDPHSEQTEWCERRLLARIHRLTLGQLRKEIQSVTPAQFMNWQLRWQHVAPGTQLLGERGTLEAIRQVQGFEAPANSWERQILKGRIADYDPKM